MPLGVFSTLFMGCLTPFVDALTLAFEAVGPPRQLLAVRLFGYALAYSLSDSFLNLFDRFLLFTDLAICDLRRYLRFDASGSQIWTFRLEGMHPVSAIVISFQFGLESRCIGFSKGYVSSPIAKYSHTGFQQ